MVAWEWQVWRCFDGIRETFEEKGWEFRFGGRDADDTITLLAESGEHYIAFFARDPGIGECWFELRNKARDRVVLIRGASNIPAPKRAAELLADHGALLGDTRALRGLPLYSLPMAPVISPVESR